jgi:2-polyprenyl-6-methoxyphenol hydroxylase-like FAD-dependent oxidoreductase
MDKIYTRESIPRFTKDDTIRFIEKHSGINIRPGITIADFWERIDNYSFVCLEEGIFKLWTYGRIACVGDSVHKMTPNIGAGGNAGIESAAALANAIYSIKQNSNGKSPSTALVEEALEKYQKEREKGAATMVRSAGEVTRMQAGRSLYHRVIAKAVRLYPGDFIADYLSGYFSGAAMLVRKIFIKLQLGLILPCCSHIYHHLKHPLEGINHSIQPKDGPGMRAS